MRYWITPDGSYYEGENVASGSIEVTQRPSSYHTANIANGAFVGWIWDDVSHKSDSCIEIDTHAGTIRDSYISSGAYVDQEYKLAEKEATDYKAAIAANGGSATGITVPDTVQSWATASGNTAVWAADNILSTATILYSALKSIRAARLPGKAAVNAATDSAGVEAAKAAAISALDALKV